MSAYLFFIGGMGLLLFSGEMLAALTIGVARRLGFLPITIALTITALATSAPEIFVSAIAALEEQPALALGNVAGSNISNQWLVLGLTALFVTIPTAMPMLRRNATFSLAAVLLSALFAAQGGIFSRFDGFILLAVAFCWFAYSLQSGKNQEIPPTPEETPDRLTQLANAPVLMVAGGFATAVLGLGAGAHATLTGAEGMAHLLGLSDAFIGLTALAIGTSLPELATSIAAARRKQAGIVLGNILGSTLLNSLVVLGIAASLHPITVAPEFIYLHFPTAILACLTLLPFVFLHRPVARASGTAFLIFYAIYIGWIFMQM